MDFASVSAWLETEWFWGMSAAEVLAAAATAMGIYLALTLLLRPEDAKVNLGVPPAENTLSGKVRDCIFMGTRFEAQVETESGSFTAWSATALPEGSPLSLTWPASTILCLKD